QGAHLKWITGYGDYSSYYGLYRIWEVTGDEKVKNLLVALLKPAMEPDRFSIDDSRLMDFFAVWAYHKFTQDEAIFTKLAGPIQNFITKVGHAMRRLEFLKLLSERGKLPTI